MNNVAETDKQFYTYVTWYAWCILAVHLRITTCVRPTAWKIIAKYSSTTRYNIYDFFKRHFAMLLDWFLPWEGRRYTLGWLSRYSVRSSHVVNNAHLFAVKYHTSIPYTMNLHCTWFRHLLWHSFNPIFGSVPVVSDIFPWSPHQTSWYAVSQSTKMA